MNFYEATIFFVVLAICILAIALPAALITPSPDVGAVNAAQFYNEAHPIPWIIHVTPSCVPVPSTDYSQIRHLSNTLFPALVPPARDPRALSALAWGFGQLLMSDIIVMAPDTSLDPVNITLGAPYPPPAVNDTAGPASMNVTQLMMRCGVNNTQNPWGCCEVANEVTSILDLSWLYGSSTTDAAVLRSGIRGQMLLSQGGNLPIDGQGLFVSGLSLLASPGPGVNENVIIAALTTLFALEHNFWANELYALNPGWSDDQLFYKARSYLIAEYQSIVFNEWIPAVLPIVAAPPMGGAGGASGGGIGSLNSSQATLEFATAAAQFFRSMVNGVRGTLDAPWVLPVTFLNGTATVASVVGTGVPAILFNAWNTGGDRYDARVAATLCNNTNTTFDYISQILVWEQMVGLAPYTGIRTAYGIPAGAPVGSPSAPPLSGMYSENPLVPGSSLSYTTLTILSDQLRRSALYDPWFYTNPGMPVYLGTSFYQQLIGARLGALIQRNTGIQSRSPFFQRVG